MGREGLHVRLYRALLRLFPAEFRGDFGDQMTADFDDQRRDVHGKPREVRRLWVRTAVDLLQRAPREHLDVALRRELGLEDGVDPERLVELEGEDHTPYDDRQYAVLSQVVVALRRAYPSITNRELAAHSDIAPGRKTDPGPAFDWLKLYEGLG